MRKKLDHFVNSLCIASRFKGRDISSVVKVNSNSDTEIEYVWNDEQNGMYRLYPALLSPRINFNPSRYK